MVLGWLNLQLLFSLVLSSMLSHMNFLHCMFGLVQLVGIVGMFEHPPARCSDDREIRAFLEGRQ